MTINNFRWFTYCTHSTTLVYSLYYLLCCVYVADICEGVNWRHINDIDSNVGVMFLHFCLFTVFLIIRAVTLYSGWILCVWVRLERREWRDFRAYVLLVF